MGMRLDICHLYPREMNIYGDHGNALVLRRRAELRGIEVRMLAYHPGADFPAEADIILGGGGQDSGQTVVQHDLPRIAAPLRHLVEDGAAALMICGMYQLFGNYFKTANGEVIEGLGIFDLHTEAGDKRMIGNIVTESEEFGELIGYENHSGRTWLGPGLQPLARVRQGDGNNGQDKTEGARLHNAIGTYLHGPLLPKNPVLADHLLAAALRRRYGEAAELKPLPQDGLNQLEEQARSKAKTRPR